MRNLCFVFPVLSALAAAFGWSAPGLAETITLRGAGSAHSIALLPDRPPETAEDTAIGRPRDAAGNSDAVVTIGPPPVAPAPPPDTRVRRFRVVGPKFLPDPEEAIDLRAPAPTPGL